MSSNRLGTVELWLDDLGKLFAQLNTEHNRDINNVCIQVTKIVL